MPPDQNRNALNTAATHPDFGLNLRFSGTETVDIRGAFTGAVYRFSPLRPVQPVDPRDAVFLLGRRSFRLPR
jgi:hypothetical protein